MKSLLLKILLGVFLLPIPICADPVSEETFDGTEGPLRISDIRAYDTTGVLSSRTILVPKDYPTIQQAVDIAVSGDIIQVAVGKFDGAKLKAGIKLIGSGADQTLIYGIVDTASGCTVENLAIIGGHINIGKGVVNVLIKKLLLNGGNYGIFAYGDNTFIAENNTIVNHGYKSPHGGFTGAGIYYQQYSKVIIQNNIIVNNPGYGILTWWKNNIVLVQYNDVFNNGKDYLNVKPGDGSVSNDPLFKDEVNGDYHITKNSLCIDAGNPDPTYNDLDGTRNDLGAFPYIPPGIKVKITKLPEKVLKHHKYIVEWKLEGDLEIVEQTEILWGLASGEYVYSGNSFSGEQKEFKDELQAPKMKNEKDPFYIYLSAHALVDGNDSYSEEVKIEIIHDRREYKQDPAPEEISVNSKEVVVAPVDIAAGQVSVKSNKAQLKKTKTYLSKTRIDRSKYVKNGILTKQKLVRSKSSNKKKKYLFKKHQKSSQKIFS